MSENELLAILYKNNIWTPKEEEEMDKISKALEDLKVGLYEHRLRSNAKVTIRKAIQKTREEISRLENLRHCLDYVTIEGLAIAAKLRYLIGTCLYFEDDTPYWTKKSWDQEDPFIDRVMDVLSVERLSESDFREIVRNDPWRSIWGARKESGRGLFDCAAADLSDDQRTLILWSNIYDNIREYPDCPNEDIISDDDMLDGWMIIQRRKRETESIARQKDFTNNKKISDADEVYLMTDTVDDAREVEKMNDIAASTTKKQRMAFLKQKGEVNEVYMPDTAQKIQMELNRLEQMKMRQLR